MNSLKTFFNKNYLKINVYSLMILLMLLAPHKCQASAKTKTQYGVTLTYETQDPAVPEKTLQDYVDTFFTVYPKIRAEFPHEIQTEFGLVISPTMKSTYMSQEKGALINISSEYAKSHPQDLDIVTWCVANGVIWYPNINWEILQPQWIVESLNEWAIYVFGVNDEGHVHSIGEYNLLPNKNYSVGYMTATRFLVWLENHFPFIVKKLFQAAAIEKDYSDTFWISETNKTVDELWIDYTKNPKTFRPKRDEPILFDSLNATTFAKAKSSTSSTFNPLIFRNIVFYFFMLVIIFSL